MQPIKCTLLLLFLIISFFNVFSQKYEFNPKKKIFVQEADTSIVITIKMMEVPNNGKTDTLYVKDIRKGDAGLRDYDALSSTGEIMLLATSLSPKVMAFTLTIKKDDIIEPNEDIMLQMRYHYKNGNGNDTTIYDTCVVIITEPVQTKTKTKDEKIKDATSTPFITSFTLLDTIYSLSITTATGGYNIAMCKLKANGLKKDTCSEAFVNEDIDDYQFALVFKFLLSKVGTADNIKGSSPLTNEIAHQKYLEWKNRNDKIAKKLNEEAENASEVASFNTNLKTLETSILKVLSTKQDSGYAKITSNLYNIPLYTRSINNIKDDKTKKVIDRLSTPLKNITYNKTSEVLNLDSLYIRLDDGFITRIMLEPDANSVTQFNINPVTIIRKYYDLRSSTDAADVLNTFIPLESNKYYIKTRITSSKDTVAKKFGYDKSPDDASRYIYSGYYIRIGDFLKYLPNIDSLGDVLLNVKNRNLSFGKNKLNIPVVLNDKDFNSFSQLNVFSDLVGLSEDKPNGLIQIEGKFESSLFGEPINNSQYFKKIKYKKLPSASISFGLSKIENKLRYYVAAKDSVFMFNENTNKHDDTATKNKSYINNINVLQYNNMFLNVRLNLFSVESDFVKASTHLEMGIIRTPVNDTTNGKDNLGKPIVMDNKFIMNSYKLQAGLIFKVKSTSKLGLEVGADWMRIKIHRPNLIQTYASYNKDLRKEEFKQSRYNISKSNLDPQLVAFSANIYYFLDKDHTNRIYLRAKYLKEIRSRSDDALFVQMGYSTDMKGLFGLLKRDN